MHTMKESMLRLTGSIFMQTTNALDRKTQEVVAFESCWLRLKATCVVLSISLCGKVFALKSVTANKIKP